MSPPVSRRPWLAADPAQLPQLLAGRLATDPGRLRVAIDGPDCASPHQLAASLLEPLRARGRPAAHVDTRTFWRDAALRLEYGRTDLDSFAQGWLDTAALLREVLEPFASAGRYLPSLRDPVTNRVTRAAPVELDGDAILLVSGGLLLGQGLTFDRALHLAVSPAARGRRTHQDLAWTLPAYDTYDRQVDPLAIADIVLRLDHPGSPAISGSL